MYIINSIYKRKKKNLIITFIFNKAYFMSNAHIAIVVSLFNSDITEPLLKGAVSRLLELNIANENITIVRVPGAVEIPLTAKLLALTKKYQAIICLGAVIKGETNHYDYVCQQVSQGCQQVMLDYAIPIIFGVLTTTTTEQAIARSGDNKDNKGRESAEAAVTMIDVVRQLTVE
jgi:6,7-dimethyl-8-ribityllumazine synthase